MTTVRSFLFVPGDSERKLGKGQATGADALILDLEDAVAPERKEAARSLTAEYLSDNPPNKRDCALWVRINPLDTERALADLARIVGASPDGIVLPKAKGVSDVQRLSHFIDSLEVNAGLERGSISILPITTETAGSPFTLAGYAEASVARLYGLTWGAEDLSAALGASSARNSAGELTPTYPIVRSMCLMAARAAAVQPVETLFPDFRDLTGLRKFCEAARTEGFTGCLAIHPDQVPVINAAFVPSTEETDHARRVIAAFAAEPGAGVVALDGQMLDGPHLAQARHIVALAASVRGDREC